MLYFKLVFDMEINCPYCNVSILYILKEIQTVAMENYKIIGKKLCYRCENPINFKIEFIQTTDCYFCKMCEKYCSSIIFPEINI